MAKFLVTYYGVEMPADPEQMKASRAAFEEWLSRAGTAVIDPGAPLGAVKSVASDGITDGASQAEVRGYTLLEAADLDAAADLLVGHPFLAKGGTLQVHQAVAV